MRIGSLWVALAAAAATVVGCPASSSEDPPPGAGVPSPSASGSPVEAPLSEGDEGGEQARVDPDSYTPGEPYPIPSPLPEISVGRPATSSPAVGAGESPIEFWIGGKGQEDGRFAYPRAMVTTKEGTLYVADKTGRIQRFTPEGQVTALVRTPGIVQGKPTGMGIDPAGKLLVADTHYCRVLTYSADLQLEKAYGGPGREPGQFMMITAVQSNAEGSLHYTTDFGDDVARVQVFRPDGTLVRTWGTFGEGPLQFKRPMNLAIDEARARVLVADAANHRVNVFDLEGKPLLQIGGAGREPGQLQYPYDVKLDEEGRVWVAEFGNQRISVFGPEGTFLGTWGKPGRELGGLNRCWAVALGPKDRVWALDSNGNRCYALTRGAFLGSAK